MSITLEEANVTINKQKSNYLYKFMFGKIFVLVSTSVIVIDDCFAVSRDRLIFA